MNSKPDRLDRQLLNCLQSDNNQTIDELSGQVGRSPSAVARRLRRLRSSGLIAAEVAVLSEEAAGYPLSVIVHLQLDRHVIKEVEILRRQLSASAQVQLCLEVSGNYDIVLLVVAADMAAYNDFADSNLANHPAVRRFESTFVKKRIKLSLAVPL